MQRVILQVPTEDGWRNVIKGTTIGADFSATFKPVTTSKARLQILDASRFECQAVLPKQFT